jgi:hypothetical protein
MDSLVIGSRLDTEVNANACRLAFSGRLVARYDAKTVSFNVLDHSFLCQVQCDNIPVFQLCSRMTNV